LRHTAATAWLRMTGDLKAVQSLMGHSTASMTLALYAHVLNDTLTRAADVMAKGPAEAAEIDGKGTREPGQNGEGS
ncbi:MAG: tyrosine-type recombinase/integrase, partial [Oryzihumus sp.]